MAVTRGDAVDMTELDEVAISSSAAGSENDSIAGSHHRGSGSSSVIGSLVSSSQAQDRMESSAGKPGGDPAELHRGPQKCPPQRIAVRIEVLCRAAVRVT